MKIDCRFNAKLLSTNSTTGKNGTVYHQATIFCPDTGEAGQLNVSENVAKDLVIGSDYEFHAEWNDKYSSFRIIGATNE